MFKYSIHSLVCCFGVLTAGLLPVGRAMAQGVGDLLIAPTRLVLDSGKRTAEVNLINIGDKPATYRITLIHQRMNADGKLEEIQTPASGEQFADDLVRFTPRQVVLEPHVSQLVRVQLRLSANLADGEYRSHLLFRAVPIPDAATVSSESASANAAKGVSIRITPIYGVSIPVIVRSGKTYASTTIKDLKADIGADGVCTLTGRINRVGNSSVYGDLIVNYAPKGQNFRTVGRMAGIAVYTPNTDRNFSMRLTPVEGQTFRNGTIRIAYQPPPVESNPMFAEATLVLP